MQFINILSYLRYFFLFLNSNSKCGINQQSAISNKLTIDN